MTDKEATKKPVKVDRAVFGVDFYDAGKVKYAKGADYPLTAETESQIAAGNATKANIEMDADEHAVQLEAATGALNASRKATIDAEAEAKKRGELK